jgi:hypothetical protein
MVRENHYHSPQIFLNFSQFSGINQEKEGAWADNQESGAAARLR